MQENVLYDLIGRQDKGLALAYQVSLKKFSVYTDLLACIPASMCMYLCICKRYLCCQRLGLRLFRFCLFPCFCVSYVIMIHLSEQRYKEGGDPVVLLEPLKVRKGGLIAR